MWNLFLFIYPVFSVTLLKEKFVKSQSGINIGGPVRIKGYLLTKTNFFFKIYIFSSKISNFQFVFNFDHVY